MARALSNLIGFDDGPFSRDHRGEVRVVGTVYAGLRLDGVLSCQVRKDGDNATETLACTVLDCKFLEHAQGILIQGITLGGFNVVDIQALSQRLALPVMAVCRSRPDMAAVKQALLAHIPDGARKWQIIKRTGPVEPVGKVFVQRAGLSLDQARAVVEKFAVYSHMPEPLRTAHLIAGGIGCGQSRGRV